MGKTLIAVFLSYLIGSFPTAFVFGKILKGIDIRQHGSGNVGATNAIRILGKGPGTLVLCLDIVKGLFAVTFLGTVFGLTLPYQSVLLGVGVVSGHNWTIFLQFKGGKGMATSFGVLLGLTVQYPWLGPALLACLLIWCFVFFFTGYVSLASMASGICLPIAIFVTCPSRTFLVLALIFSAFVIIRHRLNIQRLLQGKEPRVPFPLRRKGGLKSAR